MAADPTTSKPADACQQSTQLFIKFCSLSFTLSLSLSISFKHTHTHTHTHTRSHSPFLRTHASDTDRCREHNYPAPVVRMARQKPLHTECILPDTSNSSSCIYTQVQYLHAPKKGCCRVKCSVSGRPQSSDLEETTSAMWAENYTQTTHLH